MKILINFLCLLTITTNCFADSSIVKAPFKIKSMYTQFGTNQNTSLVKPPLNPGRIIGELFAGGLTGYAVGAMGAALGDKMNKKGDFISDGAVIGGLTGFTIGVPIGVALVGNFEDETGSYGAALAGSLISTGGFLLLVAGGVDGESAALMLITSPILSTVFFNTTRGYDSDKIALRPYFNIKTKSSGIYASIQL